MKPGIPGLLCPARVWVAGYVSIEVQVAPGGATAFLISSSVRTLG